MAGSGLELASFFDATPTQIAIYGVAFLTLGIRALRNRFSGQTPLKEGESFIVLAHGALVVPFVQILLWPLSSQMMKDLGWDNKVLIAFGAFAALSRIIGEIWTPRKADPVVPAPVHRPGNRR